ncbi:MAG TPA: N-acetylmuramoyl-L-alanine amidase [Solirubrobacterales bacterium]|nr:N-acetylmuramoyl-L-alanine amidase [Solirubrobacterales bacterium]
MRPGALIAPAALLACAALAWVAAPALSLRPYMPGATDFKRGLPAAKRLPAAKARAAANHVEPGEPAPRWTSPSVEAPDRFDLVGVARELRPLQLRVRDHGGEWSDWVVQEDGTPIWAGGADEVQVRAAFQPRGTLYFVNVSGTAGGFADRLLNSARRSINSAFIAVASTPVAQALSPKPLVVKRASWGADLASGGCPPRGPAEYGGVNAAIVHHTVNANVYTPEEAPGIVLGICRFHVYGNGWNDIGYNALVDRYGTVYEGRAGGLKQPVVGAQAQGYNSQTTSIASIGDHTLEPVTPEATRSLVRYLSWRLAVGRITPATGTAQLTSAGGSENRYPAGTVVTVPRIVGHLTLGLTACPGTLDAQLPAIRTAVQKRIKRYAKSTGKRKCAKRKRKGKKCRPRRKPGSGGAQVGAR